MTTKPPNILFILADQLTPLVLPAYGNKIVKTPNINRLLSMKQYIQFNNSYCNSPLCGPSRSSLLTGKLPSVIGAYDNASYLPSNIPTFAHYLNNMGYDTITAGKNHFVGADQLHGFKERLTTDIYPSDFGWTANWDSSFQKQRYDHWYHNMSSVEHAGYAAITNQFEFDDELVHFSKQKLYELSRKSNGNPWGFFIGFTHPHDPYVTKKKYWDLYQDSDIDLPKNPDIDRNDPHSMRLAHNIDLNGIEITKQDVINARRGYYGNISYVDDKIGEIIDLLIECDAFDNTVIIISSDHGDMLGENGLWYKMTFREYAMRVPLIIHLPQKKNMAMKVEKNVSLVDILPTMIDIASINNDTQNGYIDDELNGKSLLRYLRDDDADLISDRNIIFGEYFGEGAVSPMIMIKHNEYK